MTHIARAIVTSRNCLQPLTDVASECPLCLHHEQVLAAIITLAMSDIPCTCDGASRRFTCDYLLAMATINYHAINQKGMKF